MPRREGFGGFPIACEGTSEGTPDIICVHATGFCKELWRPIARDVEAIHPEVTWLSIDARGHGASGRGEPPYSWRLPPLDILAVLGEHASGVVGVGHSMGGGSLARAEIERPGTFRSLVLIEPIVFPPPFGRVETPLADVALNRRRVFPDRASTHRRFAERGPFASWDHEVLDLYVDHGWGPGPGGWTIRCAPEVEAEYYREANNIDTWDRLPEIDTPVTIVVGERSDSHHGDYLGALRSRFGREALVVIEDAGHLVPMERPHLIGELVATAV